MVVLSITQSTFYRKGLKVVESSDCSSQRLFVFRACTLSNGAEKGALMVPSAADHSPAETKSQLRDEIREMRILQRIIKRILQRDHRFGCACIHRYGSVKFWGVNIPKLLRDFT